ncbi:MAG: tetraacyldisaccharide 4'-kinase [Porticoccaceae bacterium]
MTALERAWYRPGSWSLLLAPLAWLFVAVTRRRRRWLEARQQPLRLPVVVVGNITVGGTGKTPLIIALVKALQARGYKPGVISRGYGGRAPVYPMRVTADSDPGHSGDEPLLIAITCDCPVVVDPDRVRAARYLENHTDCEIILSDDGLQHYRLPRDMEIVVVDGERVLGNGWCLPAGPLREPLQRLQETDFAIVNGGNAVLHHPRQYRMFLQPLRFRRVDGSDIRPVDEPPADFVNAVAGIGNPTRFARTLASLGLAVKLHPFPDHHRFVAEDLVFDDGRAVILTAKDAVKCRDLNAPDLWVLDVAATLENSGMNTLVDAIENLVVTL